MTALLRSGLTLEELHLAADEWIAGQEAAKAAMRYEQRRSLLMHEMLEAVDAASIAAHVKACNARQDAYARRLVAEVLGGEMN